MWEKNEAGFAREAGLAYAENGWQARFRLQPSAFHLPVTDAVEADRIAEGTETSTQGSSRWPIPSI